MGIVGAGGLGSPAAFYLAAAGVGTLGLIDSDRVEESNLQRQILHTPSRINQLKTDSAEETLKAFNPDLTIEKFPDRMCDQNARELLARFDLVVDGSDNFATHYLINDLCLELAKPFVFASVLAFEGQMGAWKPNGDFPCYRCLYPEAPPPEIAPPCAFAGVLGAVPGVLGTLQAIETIKMILGIGRPLAGRMLSFDALTIELREFVVARDPDCPSCGS